MAIAGVSIKRPQGNVMGIDVSSKTLAYAVVDRDGKLLDHGELVFSQKDTTKRLVQAKKMVEEFNGSLENVDYIVLEKPIFVNSNATASILSQFAGVVKSIVADGREFQEIAPTEWYKVIGNKGLNKQEKEAFAKANPGKSATWLKGEYRKMRKQRTMDWVMMRHGVAVDNDNIADAIGCTEWWISENK